nr:uncharacterized protein LOC104103542 [Nicotiana tomentosiformis]XP_018628764.1 uncharacterized protein LOC104103542 [Nicotiana tomentosiformis]XP_018628765.1 uncharacterized protein LOC104103542 [Nicotiana tomentosiformis]
MGSSERLRSSLMVYRNLLKEVEKHIGKEEHKVHFTDFIREEFRKKSNLECPKDPSFIQRRINLAQNYAYLLNSVHHHKVSFISLAIHNFCRAISLFVLAPLVSLRCFLIRMKFRKLILT